MGPDEWVEQTAAEVACAIAMNIQYAPERNNINGNVSGLSGLQRVWSGAGEVSVKAGALAMEISTKRGPVRPEDGLREVAAIYVVPRH
jgi:hypothetical protein